MADTAYANLDDVENILPPDEEMPEEPSNPANPSREYRNLSTALLEATDVVIGYLEREFSDEDEDDDGVPDDVPPAVRRVVARVAMRNFIDEPWNPGAESEVNLMGPFSHTLNWSKEVQARDLFLTDFEKTRLDRFKLGYRGSVVHIPMSGACGTDWHAATTQ
jgi:hypothetical protein